MSFENVGLADLEVKFSVLQLAAESVGFVFASQWDYERVTFDYKIPGNEENVTYYLRVQGYAIEGEVPDPDAKIKLLNPILGKHYYPHGVEYDEEFSKNITDKCTKKLEELKEKIEQLS